MCDGAFMVAGSREKRYWESQNYILSFHCYAFETHETEMPLIYRPLAQEQTVPDCSSWRLLSVGDNKSRVFTSLNKVFLIPLHGMCLITCVREVHRQEICRAVYLPLIGCSLEIHQDVFLPIIGADMKWGFPS